ncbi:Zn-dependent protease [Rhizocola hellebori]|uniref:Zn-dependent protease n=1 Tax=Rhizocola hellebori TaxID=1392758 RepID=A0A8J3QFS9_9ACTN|nr:site-2 protease family protein [Rhizocola hellebori]GIH08827.1 Zn-dependent protease [Rhizocola hellebori]
MIYVVGLVLFALGILLSLLLHEAGHFFTARAFGMKVTRFFVGYGPTLWSVHRRGVEYGVKAIPAGAFVRIVGMTPQDDEVAPADEPRAMWRFPVWKRTIVMGSGAATHFLLGILILWGLFSFVPLQDSARLQSEPVRIDRVSECVDARWNSPCTPGTDPASPARQLGLRTGDVITAVDGSPVLGWDALTAKVRAAGGQRIELTYLRDGRAATVAVTLPMVQRIRLDVLNDPKRTVDSVTDADLEQVGSFGITPVIPTSTAGPIAGVGKAWEQTGTMFANTFASLARFPAKIPALWASVTGGERDPQTPVSVIGASHIGGQLFDRGEIASFLLLLAALNFFIGLFNLLPMLPADGGHIAIFWFERARAWFYALLGKGDPGRVDYYKLMPITYAAILIFGAFTVLTVAADLINPITLPF